MFRLHQNAGTCDKLFQVLAEKPKCEVPNWEEVAKICIDF